MSANVTKTSFANEIVLYAIDHAVDDLTIDDPARRIKLYRKAGLELVAMAAQMGAELEWLG